MLRRSHLLQLTGAVALAVLSLGTTSARAGTTLDNLMAAYNGEMNAHTRYLAFAVKADDEGYGQVASLFRAAAAAEFIHAQNHAEVIRSLEGKPVASVEAPTVQSTADNLRSAIEGESYERDTMYPGFIEQARAERDKAAIRTFNLARTAEAEHAKLYQMALDNLDSWRGGSKDFYVCGICGETLTALPAAKCPSCFSPREEFTVVN